jgi:hypothetical protein
MKDAQEETVGTGQPVDEQAQANGSLSFGEALTAMKAGKMVTRFGWNGNGMFVFKQIQAKVSMDIVPKMSSLPQSVKDEFIMRAARRVDRGGTTLDDYASIRYYNQFCIVKQNNDLYSWVPSANDICANDWREL